MPKVQKLSQNTTTFTEISSFSYNFLYFCRLVIIIINNHETQCIISQSPQRGEARKTFFTSADVEYIANLGYDHMRIPIDEEQMIVLPTLN